MRLDRDRCFALRKGPLTISSLHLAHVGVDAYKHDDPKARDVQAEDERDVLRPRGRLEPAQQDRLGHFCYRVSWRAPMRRRIDGQLTNGHASKPDVSGRINDAMGQRSARSGGTAQGVLGYVVGNRSRACTIGE